ncbi:MAG TPA: hypothetical protein VD763_04810 [Candidatus Saccharimonadales bacterium]|nr:hypothetical protein [Candidatus Saccharimonadales bacterium]
MSGSTDRVAVPTNGHARPLMDTEVEPASTSADGAPASPPIDLISTPSPRIAVTPTQLALGFGVIASLVLLLAGRRRRGSDDE